jgi:hypothetical protein
MRFVGSVIKLFAYARYVSYAVDLFFFSTYILREFLFRYIAASLILSSLSLLTTVKYVL